MFRTLRLAAVTCLFSMVLVCQVSAQTGDYCNRPWAVVIPNGETATKKEMLETQRAVQKYMEGGEAYMACLKREEALVVADPYNPDAAAEQEAIRARKHNAMIDEMEVVAARFNMAIEQHKSAGQGQ